MVVAALKKLDAHSVENGLGVGTPDVHYNFGWIELKVLNKWPVNKATTKVRFPKFTEQQRAWIRRRVRRFGTVFVLIKIGSSEWMMFNGLWAADNLGETTYYEMRANAVLHLENGLRSGALQESLLPYHLPKVLRDRILGIQPEADSNE